MPTNSVSWLAGYLEGEGAFLALPLPKNITWIKQGKTWSHVTPDDDEAR